MWLRNVVKGVWEDVLPVHLDIGFAVTGNALRTPHVLMSPNTPSFGCTWGHLLTSHKWCPRSWKGFVPRQTHITITNRHCPFHHSWWILVQTFYNFDQSILMIMMAMYREWEQRRGRVVWGLEWIFEWRLNSLIRGYSNGHGTVLLYGYRIWGMDLYGLVHQPTCYFFCPWDQGHPRSLCVDVGVTVRIVIHQIGIGDQRQFFTTC